MAEVDVLDDTRLEQVLQDISSDDRATMVAGEIRSKLQCIMTEFDFIVDTWPDYKALVIRRSANSQTPLSGQASMVYAKELDSLRRILMKEGVIDWSNIVRIRGCDSKLMSVFSAILNQLNKSITHRTPCRLLRATEETLQLRPVSEGFTVSSVQVGQSEMVNSTWKFRSEYSTSCIRKIIGTMPSCCLYDNMGHVVGYALTYHYGFLGMLHVKEEHRGKGYAKVIMSHLAHKCLQEQDYASVVVESDNCLSMKLHTDIGFVEVPDLKLCWMTCT
ncbi:glycine N-acyltransferase-like protein 3 [Haliotis rufescens]|uniref:glycine N-acyltransferase-like protein 3 n=1 Tax=Haliotis rufescens TaxID=6454 RepID=UPI00201F7470|nr:glycine N-acyltransferase-like protein 3 [Haliotis rufescens]